MSSRKVFGNAAENVVEHNKEKGDDNLTTLKMEVAEIKSLIHTLKRQQCKMLIMMEQLLKNNKKKYLFPIRDMKQLEDLEKDFPENADAYNVAIKEAVGAKSIKKCLTNILDISIIQLMNYDGTKGKVAFKQFKNIDSALFDICQKEGYDAKEHDTEMRRAFKLAKGRIYKKESIAKKCN